jgi:hypothetical protein
LSGAVAKLASITFWSIDFFLDDKTLVSYWGKLAIVLIIPSSWGSQLIGHFHHHHRSNQRDVRKTGRRPRTLGWSTVSLAAWATRKLAVGVFTPVRSACRWGMLPLGWDSKSRVLSTGKRNFPHEGDLKVYIKLSGNCVYKDPSCPSSNNLQSK